MATIKLIGWGYYLPEDVRRTADLLGGEAGKELERRFEVVSRRFIPEGLSGVEMAKAATLEAVERAGIEVSDIDIIVYATVFPDHQFPGMSAFLQPLLGLEGKPAMDVRCQHAGFVAALDAACAFIETGKYSTALVAGSDIHSTALNLTEKGLQTDFPFGDGAGVFIISRDGEGPAVHRPVLLTDSRYAFDYYIPLGSTDHPRMVHEDLDKGRQYQVIDWDKLWRFAMDRLPEVLGKAAENAGFGLGDADLVLIPQLKPSFVDALADATGVSPDRFTTILPEVGNIGNAAIPLAYSIAMEQGRSMSRAILAGFGSGFSLGAFALEG